jgi:hypothetical protein
VSPVDSVGEGRPGAGVHAGESDGPARKDDPHGPRAGGCETEDRHPPQIIELGQKARDVLSDDSVSNVSPPRAGPPREAPYGVFGSAVERGHGKVLRVRSREVAASGRPVGKLAGAAQGCAADLGAICGSGCQIRALQHSWHRESETAPREWEGTENPQHRLPCVSWRLRRRRLGVEVRTVATLATVATDVNPPASASAPLTGGDYTSRKVRPIRLSRPTNEEPGASGDLISKSGLLVTAPPFSRCLSFSAPHCTGRPNISGYSGSAPAPRLSGPEVPLDAPRSPARPQAYDRCL